MLEINVYNIIYTSVFLIVFVMTYFVVLFSRLLVVELFLRYDTFGIQVGKSPIGSAVTFTSLKKAKF